MGELSARLGSSQASTPHQAASELGAVLAQPGAAFHLVFASPRYDPEALAAALARALPAAPVIGCTTAGVHIINPTTCGRAAAKPW